MLSNSHLPLLTTAVIALTACAGDTTSPTARRAVQLSFASRGQAASSFAMPNSMASSDPSNIVIGANTLVITKAQVVLRDIKLERVDAPACADSGGNSSGDDGCEEVNVGPMIVDLPVGAGVSAPVTAAVPAGTYSEVEFKLHKLGDRPGDAALLAANPTLDKASIRVEGTYNGTAFVFTTDQSVKQELDFVPPIVVTTATTSITIKVDLSTWFVVGGQLVNPADANRGGQHAQAVNSNIRNSFRGFRDENHDGDEDR